MKKSLLVLIAIMSASVQSIASQKNTAVEKQVMQLLIKESGSIVLMNLESNTPLDAKDQLPSAIARVLSSDLSDKDLSENVILNTASVTCETVKSNMAYNCQVVFATVGVTLEGSKLIGQDGGTGMIFNVDVLKNKAGKLELKSKKIKAGYAG